MAARTVERVRQQRPGTKSAGDVGLAPSGTPSRLDRPGGPMGPQYRLLTLPLVALVTIIAFEAMAISTAMPIVAQQLDALRSYGLAFSLMITAQLLGIVVAGVWCDRSGPLPSMYAGQLLFASGSAVAGASPTFSVLLLGRVVAGLGAGLVIVALNVVIGRAFPSELRPRVFSWMSAAWVLPSLLGPPIAGWLATTFSWRLVFLCVVPPVAITMLVLTSQRSRVEGRVDDTQHPGAPAELADEEVEARRSHRQVAWLGVGVAVAATVLQWGAQHLVPVRPLPLVACAVGLAGLAVTVPRLTPRGTVRMARGLPSVMSSRFLLTAAFNGATTFVPLMLVSQRHLSPALAGAMLTVGALGWSTGSWVQGSDAFRGRRSELIALGGVCVALGTGTLALTAQLGWPSGVVGVAEVVAGLGMGLAMSSMAVLTLALAPASEHGRASSALQLSDALGSLLGIATAGAIFAALHQPSGSDLPVYVLIWTTLAALAAVVVVSGYRTRT